MEITAMPRQLWNGNPSFDDGVDDVDGDFIHDDDDDQVEEKLHLPPTTYVFKNVDAYSRLRLRLAMLML